MIYNLKYQTCTLDFYFEGLNYKIQHMKANVNLKRLTIFMEFVSTCFS